MLKFRIGLIRGLGANTVVDFSITVGLIAVRLEVLRERYEVCPLRNIAKPGGKPVNPCRAGPKADHQAGPGWITEGSLAVSIRHQRAAFGEPVYMGSLHHRVGIHAANPIVLVIDSDEKDVWLIC